MLGVCHVHSDRFEFVKGAVKCYLSRCLKVCERGSRPKPRTKIRDLYRLHPLPCGHFTTLVRRYAMYQSVVTTYIHREMGSVCVLSHLLPTLFRNSPVLCSSLEMEGTPYVRKSANSSACVFVWSVGGNVQTAGAGGGARDGSRRITEYFFFRRDCRRRRSSAVATRGGGGSRCPKTKQ